MVKYVIEETPCYPNKWKVVGIGQVHSNATFLYHKTIEEAKAQIEKLGGKLAEIKRAKK